MQTLAQQQSLGERGRDREACYRTSNQSTASSPGAFVQIEMPIAVVQKLIAEHKLVIEELHCLNKNSKTLIRQALLNGLFSSRNRDY